jgi:hypothetical protein
MLWYKAWLETRWRALFFMLMMLVSLFQAHYQGHLKLGPGVLYILPVFWLMYPIVLAGSGIATDAPLQPVKGAQGSMYFTLALPVSRLRLLAGRALFGMAEVFAVIVAVSLVTAIAFPEIRNATTVADGCRYAVTVLLCCSGVYGLSTLFSTFLAQQWQIWATMAVVLLFRLLVDKDFFLFRALAQDSPLITHTLPWAAMGASLGLGALFFLAAARVVQTRQY